MAEIDELLRGAVNSAMGAPGFIFDECELFVAEKTVDGALTGEFADAVTILARFSKISNPFRLSTEISAFTRTILALQKDVAATPTIDDQITVGGRRWAIKSVEADSAAATWKFQVEPA